MVAYELQQFFKINPEQASSIFENPFNPPMVYPVVIISHNKIIEKALETLRQHLIYEPIGYNHLPEEFTMRDLQCIYESFLQRSWTGVIFNENFKLGNIRQEGKTFLGGAHKARFLYSFDKIKYFEALQHGLKKQ